MGDTELAIATHSSSFGPQHRKQRRRYTTTPNKATRRKTFDVLRKMEAYCTQELSRKNQYQKKRLEKMLEVINGAFFYLWKMKKISNIRITRFYYFLSRAQKEILEQHKIKNVSDLMMITRRDLLPMLHFGHGHPDPTFLLILCEGQ